MLEIAFKSCKSAFILTRAGFEPAMLKVMSLPGYHLPYLACQS
jgi:hypothetical protein